MPEAVLIKPYYPMPTLALLTKVFQQTINNELLLAKYLSQNEHYNQSKIHEGDEQNSLKVSNSTSYTS